MLCWCCGSLRFIPNMRGHRGSQQLCPGAPLCLGNCIVHICNFTWACEHREHLLPQCHCPVLGKPSSILPSHCMVRFCVSTHWNCATSSGEQNGSGIAFCVPATQQWPTFSSHTTRSAAVVAIHWSSSRPSLSRVPTQVSFRTPRRCPRVLDCTSQLPLQ